VLKPLRLVNLILGVIAALVAGALAKTWVSPPASPSTWAAVSNASQEAAVVAVTSTPRPPLAQFDVLIEKNPFKQPPPMPVQPLGAGPPPPPLPTLVGTILVDNERRAILSEKGKSRIYTVGQQVGGGAISEIKEDRIILKKGDETIELILKAAIKSASPAAEEAASPAPPVSVPSPAFERVPVEAHPEGASPIDRQDREGRRQERQRSKEERRLQSGQSKSR